MNNQTDSMQPFLRLWFGQLMSIIGTGMTQFALAIWIWSKTGQVTPVVLTTTFFYLPTVFVGPFAGALVDRLNRRHLMLLCDTVDGLASLTLCVLFMTGTLQVWHLYLVALVSGTFQSLQVPTLMASASTLAPKGKYSRAAGLLGLSDNLSQILAPTLGGLLYTVISVGGILALDIVTFVIAVTTILSVHIPAPETTEIGRQSKGTLLQEGLFGFRFVLKYRNLLYLLIYITAVNVVLELWATFLSPMILARTGNNTATLGLVQAAGGIGAVVGGVLLSRLRSPKKFMPGLLLAYALMGMLTLPIAFENAVVWWSAAHFLFFFLHSFSGTYHQSIWQSKVPQDVQGRVFAVRRLTYGLSALFAPALLGHFADHVFEPAIRVPGQIHLWFSWLVGSQPGDGIAAMFILGGFTLTGLAALGCITPALRNLDIILPNHLPHVQPAIIAITITLIA